MAMERSAKWTKPNLLFSCPGFAGGSTTLMISPCRLKSSFTSSCVTSFGKFFTYNAFTCMITRNPEMPVNRMHLPRARIAHRGDQHPKSLFPEKTKHHGKVKLALEYICIERESAQRESTTFRIPLPRETQCHEKVQTATIST